MGNSGDLFEKKFTMSLHSQNTAVLVSSKLLRSYEMGQIDACCIVKQGQSFLLKVYELKIKKAPGGRQRSRLAKTVDYLSRVIGIDVKFEVKFCQISHD